MVTGFGAEELLNKSTKLTRDRHHGLVALEASPQEPGVAMV